MPRYAAIFTAGEPSDTVYFLTTGRAKLYQVGHEGQRVLVSLAFAGELLGESALVEQRTRPQSAVALEGCLVLSLPRTTFVSLLHEHASFAAAVAYHLAERLLRVEQHTFRLVALPVASRLANWLLAEYRQQGSSGRVQLELQRHDLAELLGMARETLSALLGRFSVLGLVQYSRRQVRILQPGLLADCAEGRMHIRAR